MRKTLAEKYQQLSRSFAETCRALSRDKPPTKAPDNSTTLHVRAPFAALCCPRCYCDDLTLYDQAPEAWIECNHCRRRSDFKSSGLSALMDWNAIERPPPCSF